MTNKEATWTSAKEQECKVTKNRFFPSLHFLQFFLYISINMVFAEETGQLELEIKYTNGDIARLQWNEVIGLSRF